MFDQIHYMGTGGGVGNPQQLDGSLVCPKDPPILAHGDHRLTDPIDECLQFIPFQLEGMNSARQGPPTEKALEEGSKDQDPSKKEDGGRDQFSSPGSRKR